MRILVCGGRNFNDVGLVNLVLNRVHRERVISLLIEGDATGADRLAGRWADENDVENMKFPALWHIHGRAAGIIRNQRMLHEGNPDAIIAFPGGIGTSDMVSRAKNAGIPVWEILRNCGK